MAKIITVGAGVQDVFLSQSDALKPVCESPERCFAKLELGAKADVNQIHFSTGGGATNAAVTFARQGHEVMLIREMFNFPSNIIRATQSCCWHQTANGQS